MGNINTKSKMELKVNSKLELVDNNVETFFEKTVTPFGTGAKIDCLKEYIGRKAYVIIRKKN